MQRRTSIIAGAVITPAALWAGVTFGIPVAVDAGKKIEKIETNERVNEQQQTTLEKLEEMTRETKDWIDLEEYKRDVKQCIDNGSDPTKCIDEVN